MVVAFEGWNDAGEAATGAVSIVKEQLDLASVAEIDSEDYFDYQFNRPTSEFDDDGQRILIWPTVVIFGPQTAEAAAAAGAAEAAAAAQGPTAPSTASHADSAPATDSRNAGNIFLLLGTEPSRGWKTF